MYSQLVVLLDEVSRLKNGAQKKYFVVDIIKNTINIMM